MTKFSILTACRNNAPFLEEYFVSMSKQQYENMEIIFVNDASTDNSVKIAEKWSKCLNVKIIENKEQKFCGGSYKIALEHAEGEICGVVDADDALLGGAIKSIINKYEQYPKLDFIYTQHYWCNKDLSNRRKGISSLPKHGKSLSQMAMEGKHCFSHWRTFRTKLRDRGIIFPDGLKYSVDKNMGFVLEDMGCGGFYPVVLYCYRYHAKNMSLTYGTKQKETTAKLARLNAGKRIPIICVH